MGTARVGPPAVYPYTLFPRPSSPPAILQRGHCRQYLRRRRTSAGLYARESCAALEKCEGERLNTGNGLSLREMSFRKRARDGQIIALVLFHLQQHCWHETQTESKLISLLFGCNLNNRILFPSQLWEASANAG